VLLLLSQLAFASFPYTGVVEEYVPTPCEPQCTLCHSTNSGGSGTVTTAFGVELMNQGLTGGADTELLEAVLGAHFAADGDVNGDGITDQEDLLDGIDPSTGESLCDGPQYGCLNHTPFYLAAWWVPVLLIRRARRS